MPRVVGVVQEYSHVDIFNSKSGDIYWFLPIFPILLIVQFKSGVPVLQFRLMAGQVIYVFVPVHLPFIGSLPILYCKIAIKV